ncbi:hypothetical protein FA951_12635 [Dermacoccus nishinomiyaensis]|nr:MULTISPECIES: hypothetical protein [Dermacoccus]TJZ95082.1 hypothetical protein FA951_12635 [Dermacoccus nishinomiyaensis]
MTHASIPEPAVVLRTFVMAHVDPLASAEFRASVGRDTSRMLKTTPEGSLLAVVWLAELGRFLRDDDSWRTDVSAVILGEPIVAESTPAAVRRGLKESPVDGAWWMPGTRPEREPLSGEFGTGDDDWWDIDLREPTWRPRVTSCSWWPLSGASYEPALLIAVLHPKGLRSAVRVLRHLPMVEDMPDQKPLSETIWNVARWLACRVIVTTGRNPAEVIGLALERAVILCNHHDHHHGRTLTAVSARLQDRSDDD